MAIDSIPDSRFPDNPNNDNWLNLDADTAVQLGWHVSCIEWSPTFGYRLQLLNPDGELVAWGYRRAILPFSEVFQIAQQARQRTEGGE